jgi:hypothetical protein
MPRYQITTTYSSPAELTPEQHRHVSAAIEGAAVAALRLATATGNVPPNVADALTLISAWQRADAQGLPMVAAAAMPAERAIAVNAGD